MTNIQYKMSCNVTKTLLCGKPNIVDTGTHKRIESESGILSKRMILCMYVGFILRLATMHITAANKRTIYKIEYQNNSSNRSTQHTTSANYAHTSHTHRVELKEIKWKTQQKQK